MATNQPGSGTSQRNGYVSGVPAQQTYPGGNWTGNMTSAPAPAPAAGPASETAGNTATAGAPGGFARNGYVSGVPAGAQPGGPPNFLADLLRRIGAGRYGRHPWQNANLLAQMQPSWRLMASRPMPSPGTYGQPSAGYNQPRQP